MAEVSHQLLMTSKGEETDQQFIDAGTRIKQVEGAIKEEMKERSCEARSGAFTTQEDADEHNTLHQYFHAWLRRAKRDNMEGKSSRLYAQVRHRVV